MFFLTFQTLNIIRFITWQISWKPNRMWKRSRWHSFKISSHSQSATVKLHTVLDEANCYRINAESDVLQWSIWTVNCLMYSETKLNNADKAFDLGKLQKLLQVQCEVLHIVVCCYSVTHSCMPYEAKFICIVHVEWKRFSIVIGSTCSQIQAIIRCLCIFSTE